jgi:hypothetical protein
MPSGVLDEAAVRGAAEAAGLPMSEADLDSVCRYQALLAGFAAALLEFPLDERADGAPVFTPCSPPTPTP